jgi:hypothetical protein
VKVFIQDCGAYKHKNTCIVSKDSEDSDNDDKVPIPIFRESFGDAIQTALETHMAKSKGIWSNILPNR